MGQIKSQFKKITDPELIAKYDKMQLYVQPDEGPKTYDADIMERKAFAKSAETSGQHRAIEVAINEDDPDKDSTSSNARIHLRIINGRHRYLQDPTWKREYYYIKDIFEYFDSRMTFDYQKVTTTKEKRVIIKQIAEALMTTEGIKSHECCDIIIKRHLTRWSDTTVRKYCPARFKMLNMAVRKSDEELGKKTKLDRAEKENFEKIISEKDRENERLREENKRLQEQLKDKTREYVVIYDAKKYADEVLARSRDALRPFTQGPMEAVVNGTNGFKVKILMDQFNKRYIVEKV
ncbi:MAG: hypothetical protein HY295_04345 [Thaumarchaeota archaeon]|nr:hypothetical protein [Nitrososphaerota archaeon]